MSEDGAVTTVGWTVEVRCDEPESKSGREKTAHEHAARILIVEDEYFIAMEIEDAVRRAGHAIVGMTGSAEDAVALAEEEKPDLVLMDIRLASKRLSACIETPPRVSLGPPSLYRARAAIYKKLDIAGTLL